MYRHAYSLRHELELNALEIHHTKYEMMNHLAMMGFGLLSAFLAVVLPPRMAGLAGFLYGGIGIYHWIVGTIMWKRHHKIAKTMEATSNPSAAAPKA